jgi:hypothetical protein
MKLCLLMMAQFLWILQTLMLLGVETMITTIWTGINIILKFEWPEGAIKQRWNVKRPQDVLGCGLLLGAQKKLSIFFTANGILMGQFSLCGIWASSSSLCQFTGNQIPIDHPPMVGHLLFCSQLSSCGIFLWRPILGMTHPKATNMALTNSQD